MTMQYAVPPDLVSLIAQRADECPDRTVYRYEGATQGATSLTFLRLRTRAWSIGALLRAAGCEGERVLLLYPPGLEFIEAFFGALCGGGIAVPAPPPNPHRPERSLYRLESIVRSASPRFALGTREVIEAIEPLARKHEALRGLRWIATDVELPEAADAPPAARPDAVALLQYTSGSTSSPKGVALQHGNVLHNVVSFDEGWHHDASSVIVSWLPAFHDLGLVYGILMPVVGGFLGVQMSPIDVIQRPATWLNAITRHRATHSSGPNFIYELCAQKVTDLERRTLDLHTWRVALTAAEPVRAATMEHFTARFREVGFRPQTFCPGYGLSEGTCKVVAVPMSQPPTIIEVSPGALERRRVELAPPGARNVVRVVGCGRPGSDVSVRIVDPETGTPCASGRVGEVWVAGPAVAHSYWGQPEVSEECLRARLPGLDEAHLRTGDLGFLYDGELFVTGRIKDVIIVRGANHYPQDIEYTVERAHPSLRSGCCAAFSYEEEGEERLAVVAELERSWTRALTSPNQPLDDAGIPSTEESLASAIEAAKVAIVKDVAAEHGVRVHRVALIPAGAILKTTSGKIRRQACKDALLNGRFVDFVGGAGTGDGAVSAAYTVTLNKIKRIVSEIAGVPIETLNPDASLHGYGVDSLAGVNIAYELGLLAGREVPSGLLEEMDTIRELVDYVVAPVAEEV